MNEKLQNLINKRLIQHEAELYKSEGIHFENISYEGNDNLLDMVFQVCILIIITMGIISFIIITSSLTNLFTTIFSSITILALMKMFKPLTLQVSVIISN